MLVIKPKALAYDTAYIMQISNILIKRKEQSNLRDIIFFVVHVWPDKNKPDYFFEVKEKFFDGGAAEKYMSEFIEISTGKVYGETAYEDMIGAVFKGYIKKKVEHDQYGQVVFSNIVPIKHITYVED